MVNSIAQVLKITKEETLFKEFEELETAYATKIQPLRVMLRSNPLTTDAGQIQNHMCEVGKWRDLIGKYNALMTSFVSHIKGSDFLLAKGPNVGVLEKEAYQKKLLAGFVGLAADTEQLIKSIDSRVNECKILLRVETQGSAGAI
jgi:hypothetical protein